MENEILKYCIIGLCFVIAEIGGIDIGFQIKKHRDLLNQKRYKYFEIPNGILKLNTCSGEVYFISINKEEKLIHEGKRFPDSVETYDIENTGNYYLLIHTGRGYFTFLNV